MYKKVVLYVQRLDTGECRTAVNRNRERDGGQGVRKRSGNDVKRAEKGNWVRKGCCSWGKKGGKLGGEKQKAEAWEKRAEIIHLKREEVRGRHWGIPRKIPVPEMPRGEARDE